MKLLLLSLAALFALSQASSDFPPIEIINEGRRIFAKRFNISNMNALKYVQNLTTYADNLIRACVTKKALLEMKSEYQLIPALVSFNDFTYDTDLRLFAEQYINNPVQTQFGYQYLPYGQCKNSRFHDSVLVLGPENKYIVKSGTPGSQCGPGRVNDDGLCVEKKGRKSRMI